MSRPIDLTDAELIKALKELANAERSLLRRFLEHLMEFDHRDLAERHAFPSTFAYCVEELLLSEDEAAKRIQVMRFAERFPAVLVMMEEGRLSLTGALILSPVANKVNIDELLSAADGKSKRDIEHIAAGIAPRPPLPDRVEAISETLVRISFTASRLLADKLEQTKGLLRHKHPAGRFEHIVEDALEALLDRYDRSRKAKPSPPQEPSAVRSRHIPEWVKDFVHKRDGGRCAFATIDGKRCDATDWLEFDHILPYALGGASDDPANIRLLCRAHNQQRARAAFGEWSEERDDPREASGAAGGP